MGALSLFKPNSTGAPAARKGLVDLNDKIDRRADELVRIQAGRRRLADQLELVDGARNELESLIAQDAHTLIDRIKGSVDWCLSGLGGPRATKISESLAASRLQKTIGDRAATELDAEISRLKAELEALHAEKPHHVKAVLIEVAAGYRSDLKDIASEMRGLLTILSALDRLTASQTGDFVPGRRVVVEIPAVGGMAPQTVATPISAVDKAMGLWSEYALELDADPLAKIETLRFPEVTGEEDDGRIIYSDLSPQERSRVDRLASQTHYHHTQGVNK
jgi:hypothetical protein